jgi:hypothetical protein
MNAGSTYRFEKEKKDQENRRKRKDEEKTEVQKVK